MRFWKEKSLVLFLIMKPKVPFTDFQIIELHVENSNCENGEGHGGFLHVTHEERRVSVTL